MEKNTQETRYRVIFDRESEKRIYEVERKLRSLLIGYRILAGLLVLMIGIVLW